jgi:hypothetical protein
MHYLLSCFFLRGYLLSCLLYTEELRVRIRTSFRPGFVAAVSSCTGWFGPELRLGYSEMTQIKQTLYLVDIQT